MRSEVKEAAQKGRGVDEEGSNMARARFRVSALGLGTSIVISWEIVFGGKPTSVLS
jgi:hypothetical protein